MRRGERIGAGSGLPVDELDDDRRRGELGQRRLQRVLRRHELGDRAGHLHRVPTTAAGGGVDR